MMRAIATTHVLLVALTLAMMPLSASAQTPVAAQLAGWWISIDETGLKPLWESGVIVPMEELLIVDGQGRFENRMMGFFGVDHEDCNEKKRCSDAPLIATGRFTLAGSPATLSIEDYRATDVRIDAQAPDRAIRATAVSATRSWPVSRFDASEGILVLRKGTGHETRTFLRIEPDRLRQLRAGLMEAGLSASRHWRCWIAAVTGAARPAPGLRPAAALSPPIGDYIRIASYSLTAFAHARRPTPDDADPEQRKLAGLAVEELMNEHFDSLPLPKTFQERRNAVVVATYLRMVAQGQTPDAAKAAVRQQSAQFEPPKDLSPGQIAAIALARADSAETKRLFCKP